VCGIGGIWARTPDRDLLSRAARLGGALRHRGPDDQGWLLAWPGEGRVRAMRELPGPDGEPPPDLVFAHRRLSIVDLAGGWQPLGNEDGTVWIAYNGEIYNHLALRRELEALGHRFATRADTEMVVHAYEAWGPEGFARFNGIFAFAVWDVPRRRLVLARDPLGVKPVYCGSSGPGLWFASEIKAAMSAGLYAPALDRASLDLYLTYRFVPSPATLFAGVARVPPGHWVEADPTAWRWTRPARFAPLPAAPARGAALAESVARLTSATEAAVRGQLMADVPVGALLSGGLDSSIIVAVMRDVEPSAVPAYAIGFGAGAGEEDSELTAARRAASALGARLDEVSVAPGQFFTSWAETLRQLDEPLSTPGHVLLGMLCRRVGRDLKVVLTGQGADEPLGGYLRHSAERWAPLLGSRPIARLLRAAAAVAPRSERARRLARVASERDAAQRFVTAFTVFDPQRRRALLRPAVRRETDPDAVSTPVRYWLEGSDGLDSLNQLLYVDARLSLADDLLLGGDKVSMASSVEARVPYLDLDYLAVAERIPGRLKISWHSGRKQLQRLVGRRLLPPALGRELAAAGSGWRQKRGFDVPFARWFRSPFITQLEAYLSGPGATLTAYFERGAIQALLAEHVSGRADHTRRLVALLTLEAWHRAFVVGDSAPLAQLSVGG
jgi:asparagine synthase (glutamine-hydrolysing)